MYLQVSQPSPEVHNLHNLSRLDSIHLVLPCFSASVHAIKIHKFSGTPNQRQFYIGVIVSSSESVHSHRLVVFCHRRLRSLSTKRLDEASTGVSRLENILNL
jgi:hypothetical protein